jgi:hypothetical protein
LDKSRRKSPLGIPASTAYYDTGNYGTGSYYQRDMPVETGIGFETDDQGSDGACNIEYFKAQRAAECEDYASECKTSLLNTAVGDERVAVLCQSAACKSNMDCLKYYLDSTPCTHHEVAKKFNSMSASRR